MSSDFSPRRLDPKVFARTAGRLEGECALASLERLRFESAEPQAERRVIWRAQGQLRLDSAGQAQTWLHLYATLILPLTCQRCLGPVDVALRVERTYRFVATEEQAQVEDELSEEDVLAWRKDFDLLTLIEDELLMELPLVPRHPVCPTEVSLAVQDPDFEQASLDRPNPFAALAGLRGRKR